MNTEEKVLGTTTLDPWDEEPYISKLGEPGNKCTGACTTFHGTWLKGLLWIVTACESEVKEQPTPAQGKKAPMKLAMRSPKTICMKDADSHDRRTCMLAAVMSLEVRMLAPTSAVGVSGPPPAPSFLPLAATSG